MSNDPQRPSFADILFGPGKLFGRATIVETTPPPATSSLPAPADPALLTTPIVTPAPPPSSPAATATSLKHPISKWVLWSDTTVPLNLSLPANTPIGSLYLPNLQKVPAGTIEFYAGSGVSGSPFYASQYEAETVRIASFVTNLTLAGTGAQYGPLYVFVTEERLDPFAYSPQGGGLPFDLVIPALSGLLHYWPLNSPTNYPYSSPYTLLSVDYPSNGQAPEDIVTTSDNASTVVNSNNAPSLTTDGEPSAFLNKLCLEAGTYNHDNSYNNGAAASSVDWPVTPTGDFTVFFYAQVLSAGAGIRATLPFGYAATYHPLLSAGGPDGSIVPSISPQYLPTGNNSYAEGFVIYADLTTYGVCAIRLGVQDGGRTTLPAGYDNISTQPIAGGYDWITAPAMDDYGSSRVPFDQPFFCAVTYDHTTKEFVLYLNDNEGIPGDAAAISPVFAGPGIAIGADARNSFDASGCICYMSKVAIFETILSPEILQALAAQVAA